MEEADRYCGECYKDCLVRSWDYFMLLDELWLEVNDGFYDGKLCFNCVEDILGRELDISDLKDVSINYKFLGILGGDLRQHF
jgi:hypothetical protein|tara:strand:+ start:215 stop:460 length:246 start_codon:yes stop_codon:yes gene_type:complete